MSKWHIMYEKQMYVHPPKHVRTEHFFSPEPSPPHEHESMADDESMVDPKHKPNAVPKPLEHEHGQPRKPKRKLSKEKTRRGGVKHKKNKKVKFSILGNNTAGLKAKKDSLEAVIKLLNKPSCITLQETKLPKKNVFKMAEYQVFQKNRNGSSINIQQKFR